MTILKRSEFAQEAERVALARSGNGERAVFAEPWEAQAFALAVRLSEQGHFTWKEWAATLADELKAATDRGEIDDGAHYYHYWLAALEKWVTVKGLADQKAMEKCKQAWADAYRRTPHGKPVELGR
jgi:nitrile hydratase accessory protein